MIDHKSRAVDGIIVGCSVFLSDSELAKVRDVIITQLYQYDIVPKDEATLLPVVYDGFNRECLQRYLISKAAANLSKASLKQYHYRLQQFIYSLSKRLDAVTSDDIDVYLAKMRVTHHAKNATLEQVRAILSSFFKWLLLSELIDKDPTLRIRHIRKNSEKEEPYTKAELELILLNCKTARDRAIIELLICSGIRVSELIHLDISDIDFRAKQFKVLGKGGKYRIGYISDKCMIHLNRYLSERHDNNPALFITCFRKPSRLTSDCIRYTFSEIGKRSGVSHVHPHRFRRTLCCTLLNRGVPIEVVREIMGHTSIETTMIYYNSDDNNVKHNYTTAID